MSARNVLLAWLNNAYGMETALIPVLENHARDAREHPALQARLEDHAAETRRHADMVKGCIERLGERPSMVKQMLGSLFGMAQAPATGLADDELVKNAMMDFATENFEIASYEALIIAAKQCGEPEIAATCELILTEEQQMAEWLHEHLDAVVHNYCRQSADPAVHR